MVLGNGSQLGYNIEMCRIFGFRSILQSGVHRSLIDSDNAIIQQSDRHPDGWGVAYYNMGSPHLVKNENQARECKIFEKLSGVVSSNTVIAHIRKSTVGSVGPLNTHPFQFGPWVFAHNGNIENFQKVKPDFLAAIDSSLRPFILGETDSEHLFYLMLTEIKSKYGLLPEDVKQMDFREILDATTRKIEKIAGKLSHSKGEYEKNYFSFVLTHGQNLYAFNGGQDLFFSTFKKRCPERDSCPHFSESCEKKAEKDESIQHLLISSEIIENENIWEPLGFGEFVGVDQDFQFIRGQIPV